MSEAARTAKAAKAARFKRRMSWHKQIHQWHWISAALVLGGILIFSLTGITLNHSAQIEAEPRVTTRVATLPAALLEKIQSRSASPGSPQTEAVLPTEVVAWLDTAVDVRLAGRSGEWSADEVYLSLPRAGADAWLSIDRRSGAVEFEQTDRGWIAFFNDLHKGRNTGWLWRLFIDLVAIACLIFSATGFFLLQLQAKHRGATWPVLAAGTAVLLVTIVLH